jgi:hypothetical protein
MPEYSICEDGAQLSDERAVLQQLPAQVQWNILRVHHALPQINIFSSLLTHTLLITNFTEEQFSISMSIGTKIPMKKTCNTLIKDY